MDVSPGGTKVVSDLLGDIYPLLINSMLPLLHMPESHLRMRTVLVDAHYSPFTTYGVPMVGSAMANALRGVASLIAIAAVAPEVAVTQANTVAERPPPRTISTADLVSLRDIGGYSGNLSVSPDGRLVAFQLQQADVAARTYRVNWFVVPVSGGTPTPLGHGGEVVLGPNPYGGLNGDRAEVKAQWAPDGRWIAYLRQQAGEVQVWRSRVDGSRQEQVTHNAADVMSFEWKPDGTGIFFHVGRDRDWMRTVDQEEANLGYLLDDRFMPAYSRRPFWFRCGEQDWGMPLPASQQCTPTAWVIEFGGAERKLSPGEANQAFNASTGPRRPAGIGSERRIQNVVWNAARTRAAWFENEQPNIYPGFGAPLTLFADGARCNASACHGDLSNLWWHGDEIMFLRDEGHASSIPALYAWRPTSRHARLIYRVDGVLRSCALAAAQAICLQETPMTPRKIVAIGLWDGKLATVFDPNPEFRRYRLGAVERLEWHDAFGNPTFGHLVYPPSYQRGRRYPLVIVQYRSRGFLRGGVGNEYPIYPLAAAGFLVLSFDKPEDWQLSARHRHDTPENVAAAAAAQTNGNYEWRRALTALEIVIDTLDRRGLVDPARVGITGLSAGAAVVNFALFNSQRFSAAAHSGDWTPHWYNLAVNDNFRALFRGYVEARSGAEAIEKWKSRLITYHMAKVGHTPLLIQVSDRELISITPNHVAMKDAGKPVETYVFPGEYHIKWQPQHKLAVAERAIDWFRFWLKNEEDSNDRKSAQYQRWRQMRTSREAAQETTPPQ